MLIGTVGLYGSADLLTCIRSRRRETADVGTLFELKGGMLNGLYVASPLIVFFSCMRVLCGEAAQDGASCGWYHDTVYHYGCSLELVIRELD